MISPLPIFSSSLSDHVGEFAIAISFVLVASLSSLVMTRRGLRPPRVAETPPAHTPQPLVSKKVLIFYSSIGYGHISAAQSIRDEINQQSPATQVLLQDIRIFMHPVWRKIDERLYWFIASNLPECFESLFHSMQARGNRVPSLSLLPNDYPEEKVLAYLLEQAPDAILATHYGAAQVLGNLREHGHLRKARIGWLHTDYFEGYFPRISQRIDKSFLAHPELESHWLAAGVPADKVATSGMPVQIASATNLSREDARAHLGLSQEIPTIMLTGGKAGAGDYQTVVESVAHHCPCRMQIIAVCGTNDALYARLAALQDKLPTRIVLKVMGLVPRRDMGVAMRSADILITKAGGMTPAEAFTLGLPTILLDAISGHERENAALFLRQGLAKLATSPDKTGEVIAELLSDPEKRDSMLDAQLAFRESANIASIVQFALDDKFAPTEPPPNYGVENGVPVLDIDEALKHLDSEAPAEVELLLSYATSKTPQRVILENPFGHLAIRVDDTVYSANYVATPTIDSNLLQHMSLADYLYGTRRPSPSQVHTNTYGMAYGRETLGLRVKGIPPERRAAMAAEAQRMEAAFLDGSLRWDRSEFNCVDTVTQILEAGNYSDRSWYDWAGLPSMPLDLFERMQILFEEDTSLQQDLVAYRLLPGTQASYRFSRFPLSLGQPLRSVTQILSNAPQEALERAVTKQVTSYFCDRRLYVENLRTDWTSSEAAAASPAGRPKIALEKAILADLRHLLAEYARLPIKSIQRLDILPATQDFLCLVDRGLELARLATEHVEDKCIHPGARHLRTRYSELVMAYGRIKPQRPESRYVRAYLSRLKAFSSALEQEFSFIDVVRPRRAWTHLHTWFDRINKNQDR